jgi:DNA end-binding protein Ku
MGGVMTMATMRFADEVVSAGEIKDVVADGDVPKPEKRELEMAKALIDSLSSDFEADKYRDEYREELLALIERKAKGEEIVESEAEAPKPTRAPDLMAALEESLAAVKGEPLAAGSKKDGAAKKAPAKKRSTAKKSTGTKRSRSKTAAKSK